jgi:hypothetical protein
MHAVQVRDSFSVMPYFRTSRECGFYCGFFLHENLHVQKFPMSTDLHWGLVRIGTSFYFISVPTVTCLGIQKHYPRFIRLRPCTLAPNP